MITKTKLPSSTSYKYATIKSSPWDDPSGLYSDRQTGLSVISYDEGPEWNGNRRMWKNCTQETVNSISGAAGRWEWEAYIPWANRSIGFWVSPPWGLSGDVPKPAYEEDYSSCMGKVLDQIDLNTSDAVLLYSGVIQAIPLLGGVLKLNRILKEATKSLSKSFKKKPFTTVVKSLIQADFIDRFVVSPTIDDARKFADATNYVLRVLDTMNTRNQPLPTAFEAEETNTRNVAYRDISWTVPISNSDVRGDLNVYGAYSRRVERVSKMFLLANVAYETSQVSPIKLWAARTGLTRPLDSIWDLVPFSFVIDYFSRAGDFISGLSDEMSSQDGLRGKITNVVGCWGCTSCATIDTWEALSVGTPTIRDGYVTHNSFTRGKITRKSKIFTRKPINPWAYLPNTREGFLQWDMSSTRYRTLLELFLQMKVL